MIFTVSIQKEVIRIDKNRERIIENICQLLHFIHRARFTLSNLANNFFERIYKTKYKQEHEIKNVKLKELNRSIATVF